MSASREKKNRQELAAQGHVDPRVERQQKEAAERKKNKLIYGGVAVLFVIVAAVVLLYNSGIFQPQRRRADGGRKGLYRH